MLTKWVTNIVWKEELENKILQWKILNIKFWIDPTSNKIHLWHLVSFLRLKKFQELWHNIILIVWDSTAQIWDTSDKTSERQILSREKTTKNSMEFLKKFSKIIDIEKTNVILNSEFLDKINFSQVWELAKNFSVAEMLDRDNFKKRFNDWKRISLQEFLYPLMQWFDSVWIAKKFWSCDLEIWWNDQLFNLLAWRTLLEANWFEKQSILTFDILLWTNWEKMSKTKWNCIFLDDSPNDIFQKIINIKDEQIFQFFELISDKTIEEIDEIRIQLNNWELNIVDLKKDLAKEIIKIIHWIDFNENDIENNLTEVFIEKEKISISELIKSLWLSHTQWDIRNSIKNWSVKIDWITIENSNEIIEIKDWMILKFWKKKTIKLKKELI